MDLVRLADVDDVTRRAIVGHAGETVHGTYSTVRLDEARKAIGRVFGEIGHAGARSEIRDQNRDL